MTAIQTAWSAFENVCEDALGVIGLGNRLGSFDKAVSEKGLQRVAWGQGIWQRALRIYRVRKKFTHVVPTISHSSLLPSVELADEAISVLRDVIIADTKLVAIAASAVGSLTMTIPGGRANE